MQTAAPCPCGGATFATCCEPFLTGNAVPPTAETLMRSRYTAYTRGDEAYLRATWHPSTLPASAIVEAGDATRWLGLEIKSALRLRKRKADLLESDNTDTVEFVARYKIGGRAHRLHEVSRFVRETVREAVPAVAKTGDEAGVARWFYLDGSFPD